MKLILASLVFTICFKFNFPRNTHNHNLHRRQEHRRIINGNVTYPEKYPFVIAFMYDEGPDKRMLRYGASIVNKYWAVTAAHGAHLMYDLMRFSVLYGNTSFINGPNRNVHHLINKIDHPNFDIFSNNYDVALLKVKEPFIGVYEAPVPIAPPDYEYKHGSTALLLGWGFIDTGVTMPSWVLRVGDIKLQPSLQKCKDIYRWYNYVNGGVLKISVTNSTICAWTPNRGHCVGDSGGPVIQNGMLIGILSVRADCAGPRLPYVYTKISVFHDWIQNTIDNYKHRNAKRDKKLQK